MDKTILVALITLKEGIRNRALQGILLIALFSSAAFLVVVPLFAFETGKVVVDLGFAAMSLAGLGIVFFLAIALLTEDIHRRTICLILSRPISRAQYVLGKFFGLSIAIFLAVLIIALLAIFFGWLGIQFIPSMTPPRHFSWGILATGVLFNYISLLIIMAVAFLSTVVTTNAYLSMLVTFCVYVIGHSLETIVKIVLSGEFVKVGPMYTQMLKFFTWFFPNLSAFDLKIYIGYGLPLSASYCLWTVLYGIFYIAIVIFLTIILFKNKEIK